MAEEKARDPTKPEIKPVNIPLAKIHDLPGSVFAPPSPKSLEALTSSIVLRGVQEPVILRQREDGEFQIVSGNRRRKASELAKKTEIPAFVYDMGEREAKDFRLRDNAKGTPPGKLLSESEIGKKREAPAKTPDKTAENKAPVTQPKPSEKAAEVKVAPTPAQKKQDEKPKAAAPTEKADADGKTPVMPPKSPDKAADAKPAPAPEAKKPEEKPKAVPSLENEDADGKKPDISPKPLEKPAEIKPTPTPEQKKPEDTPKTAAPTEKIDADGKAPVMPPKPPDVKPAPTPEQKKPEEKPKAAAPTEKPNVDSKAPITSPKPTEKAAAVTPTPAAVPRPPEKATADKPDQTYMPGPAALGPTGTKITKIFEDRLMPPDEKAMKDLPVPKDGESYFITLHPAYLEKSEFNTVSVDTNSDDYKELRKSIELNGVKDPVLTRINPKGGLEVLSGQRRHMIARELNYPVPAIIQKIDDNDAMILVADSNLHRPHISTFDLSRTLRNKMTAMKRKAGRKKRGAPGADELQSDAVLAKEMGISISKLNRIVRLSEATKDVCDAVDDHSIELSIAAEISFLKPHNQDEVIHLSGIGYKPNVKRVQRLRTAEKNGKLDDT